jgi:hypothetical protein
MNLQLVGKITGLDYDQTFEKFFKYEKMLTLIGHQVTNPMRIVEKDCKWKDAMNICLASLEDQEGIFLLPDWHNSNGGRIEVQKAIEKDLEILTFYDYEKGI